MPVYGYDKPFQTTPPGNWPSVCVDVEDLGIVDSERWGPQEKLVFTWLVKPKMDDGRHHMISRWFTNSLGPKSHLGPFLRAWLGHPVEDVMDRTKDGSRRIDYEIFLGREGMLSCIQSDCGKYVNAESIGAMPDGMEVGIDASEYTRKQDRKGYETPDGVRKRDESAVLEVASEISYPESDDGQDDDLPF